MAGTQVVTAEYVEGRGYCVTFEIDGAHDGYRITRGGGDLSVEEVREQQLRKQRDRRVAEDRSKTLLLRLLTKAQRKTFSSKDYFEVTAPSGRTYRIDCSEGCSGNVYWVREGDVLGNFCCHPSRYGWLPVYDAFLGQMLLIQTDEARFLATAVFHGREHPIHGRSPGRRAMYLPPGWS